MASAYQRLSAAISEMRATVRLRNENNRLRGELDALKHNYANRLEASNDWRGLASKEAGRRISAHAALRAIIARADNHEPGTSKVQDMKRIAVQALGDGE